MGLDQWRDSSSWTWRESFFVVQQLDLFPAIFYFSGRTPMRTQERDGCKQHHSLQQPCTQRAIASSCHRLFAHSFRTVTAATACSSNAELIFCRFPISAFPDSFALTHSLTSFELACIEKTSAAQPTGQRTPVQPTLCCALRHVRLLKLHTFYKTNRTNFAFDLGSKMTKYATDHHSTTFAPLPAAAAAAVGILACKAVEWDQQLEVFYS